MTSPPVSFESQVAPGGVFVEGLRNTGGESQVFSVSSWKQLPSQNTQSEPPHSSQAAQYCPRPASRQMQSAQQSSGSGGSLDAGPELAGPLLTGPLETGAELGGALDAGAELAGSLPGGSLEAGPLLEAGAELGGALDGGAELAGGLDAGPELAGPLDAGPLLTGPLDGGAELGGADEAGAELAGPLLAGPLDGGAELGGAELGGALEAGPELAGPLLTGPLDAAPPPVAIATSTTPSSCFVTVMEIPAPSIRFTIEAATGSAPFRLISCIASLAALRNRHVHHAVVTLLHGDRDSRPFHQVHESHDQGVHSIQRLFVRHQSPALSIFT